MLEAIWYESKLTFLLFISRFPSHYDPHGNDTSSTIIINEISISLLAHTTASTAVLYMFFFLIFDLQQLCMPTTDINI